MVRIAKISTDKTKVTFSDISVKDILDGLEEDITYDLPKAHADFKGWRQCVDYQTAFLKALALGKDTTGQYMHDDYFHGTGRAKRWGKESKELIETAKQIEPEFAPPALRKTEARAAIIRHKAGAVKTYTLTPDLTAEQVLSQAEKDCFKAIIADQAKADALQVIKPSTKSKARQTLPCKVKTLDKTIVGKKVVKKVGVKSDKILVKAGK